MRRSLIIAFLVGTAGLVASAKQPSSTSPQAPTAHKVRKPRPSAAPTPGLATAQPVPAPSAVVSYQNGLLTITAENASLQQIVEKVGDSTGATIDSPALNERVTVRLGPQPPAAVIAALLEGSRVNYVIVGGADQNTIKAIQITPMPAAEPERAAPAPPPSPDAEAAATMAKALFIAQTGGDEGVWDNVEVGTPVPTPPTPAPAPSTPAVAPGHE